MSIIGQTAISNLAREVAELKQRNSDRLVPVEVVVETVTPLVLTLPDGEKMEGATPLGAQLEAGKPATLLIGEGRAWVWRQVEEAEQQPGEMASEHAAAMEQLKFETERAEESILETQAEAVEARAAAAVAAEAVDGLSETVSEVREEILPPLQDAMAAANTKLSEHTQEIQDQHNDLVALRQAAVTGTTVEYAVGSSETVPPEDGWSTETPTRTPGSFIWFRTVVERGDTSTTTNPALLTGNDGAPGSDGDDGSDGRSVTSVDVWYYLSASPTFMIGGEWQTTAPTWASGRHMWSKTITTYSDDSTSESAPVNLTGARGAEGVDGDDGRSVTKIEEEYYLSTSSTSLTGGEWDTTPQTPIAGRYFWTRTKFHFSDSTVTTTDPIMVSGEKGADGQDGTDGVSVVSVTTYYLRAASRPLHPSGNPPNGGWTEEEPGYLFGFALWRTEQVMLSNGNWSYTPPTLVGGDAALENAIEARREFVTYEWAGARHASESIEKMNGREVRRNYVKNPSFELNTTGWDSPSSTGSVIRSSTYQGQMWDPSQGGQGNAWIPYSDNGRADIHHVQWRASSTADDNCYLIQSSADYVSVTPGEWIAVGGLVATEQDESYLIDVVAQFRIGGTYVGSGTEYSSAKFYPGRLVRKVLQVPEGADSVRIVLWLRRNGGLPENVRAWADAIALYKAPSEAEAWTQLSLGYFDGDTPSGAGDERITNAQLSANRRNQIIPALTGPIGSTHPETGEPLTKGDTWWRKDTLGPGGVVKGEWHWDGGAWRSATIGHEVISSVDVNDLNVYGTAQMKTAVIDKLWADGLFAKTGLFQKLTVSGGNIIPNGDGRAGRGDGPHSAYSFSTSGLPNNSGALGQWTLGSNSQGGVTLHGNSDDEAIYVDPTREYVLTYWAANHAPGNLHYLRMDRLSPDGLYESGTYLRSAVELSSGWTKLETTITPAQLNGTSRISFTLWGNHPNATGHGIFRTAGWSMIPKTDAVLIEDGAVTANKVQADLSMANTFAGLMATFEEAFIGKVKADFVESGSFSGKTFNGGTFTGSTFRTSASTQRVQMDKDGLRAYNSSGYVTFNLTGGSGEITGFTVTGGIIRTSDSGQRAQLDSTNGGRLRFLGPGGALISAWENPTSGSYLSFRNYTSGSTLGAERVRLTAADGLELKDEGGTMRGRIVAIQGRSGLAIETPGHLFIGAPTIGGGTTCVVAFRNQITLEASYVNLASTTAGAIVHPDDMWRIRGVSAGNMVIESALQYVRGSERMPQTTLAPNLYMATNGYVFHTTSSQRWKLDIRDIGSDPSLLLDVPVRDWIDKSAASLDEGHADRTPGVVAEEVEAAGLGQFVTYGLDGEVTGVMYDRLTLLLIPLVRDLRDRITTLEEQHG